MDPDNLRAVPLFAAMAEPDLRRIAVFAAEDSVAPGATLMREGDYGNDMLAIESGTARVIRDGRDIATVGPGDIVGEMGVLNKELRTASVVSASAMRFIRLSGWDVKRLPKETRERLAELMRSRRPPDSGTGG